ncbi:hypothetical protein ACMD2_26930 [Ananas comosus]|uniref:Glyoxalase/fosfomycin resistance/dioxygenase domain-containing protein n=1 Tax=Ananas comosus TaxID=4615 RepID=A0A199UYW5_ANACO|nr:hypothetical protein ACMD2_26930 [Ananas comosus]
MLERKGADALPLASLNHVSMVCRSVERLFNYGIGIHLLQSEDPESMPKKAEINPKDNHISFQCESMALVEKKLKEMEIDYIQQRVEEGGVYVDQLFFHDPDGFMIEICNCDNLPVIPLVVGEPVRLCKRVSLMKQQQQQQQQQQSAQFLTPAAVHVSEDPHNIPCA